MNKAEQFRNTIEKFQKDLRTLDHETAFNNFKKLNKREIEISTYNYDEGKKVRLSVYDIDVRVLVKNTDNLQRLVNDFNRELENE